MRLVSVDIGNGFVKAKSSTQPVVFPSAGAMEQGALTFDGLNPNHDLVIEFEGERWAIGDTAYKLGRMQVIEMGRGRITESHYRRLYAAALATTVRQSDDLAIVASLPVRWYTGEREAARDVLAGEYTVTYGDRECTYRINRENTHIVPEGFGSLCTQVLNQQGRIMNADIARSVVGVVDIGTRTTDYLYFNQLDLHPASSNGQDGVGMATVWQLVGETIGREYRRELSEYEIDDAVQTRQFRDGPRRVPIGDLVDTAAARLAETIGGKIRSLWDGGREVEYLLITGGGSYLVYPFLDFEHKQIIADGYFANVDGAYRFGLLRGFADG